MTQEELFTKYEAFLPRNGVLDMVVLVSFSLPYARTVWVLWGGHADADGLEETKADFCFRQPSAPYPQDPWSHFPILRSMHRPWVLIGRLPSSPPILPQATLGAFCHLQPRGS